MPAAVPREEDSESSKQDWNGMKLLIGLAATQEGMSKARGEVKLY